MAEALVSNARLRDEGTRNLVSAAVHAGARRLVAQSIAFVYAPGPLPHDEDDPLDVDADDANGVTARGVASLERQVLEAPVAGVVLRYGALYGPGTGFDAPWGPGSVHVDAAAKAAELAVTRDVTGIYNIAEEDGAVSSEKARRLLGWDAAWRASGVAQAS
jgi:nucleoside-diphosphate-sugar epimerase